MTDIDLKRLAVDREYWDRVAEPDKTHYCPRAKLFYNKSYPMGDCCIPRPKARNNVAMTTNKACWIMAAVLAVMIVWGNNAKADELYLGAWSKHFIKGDYNEVHNLVGINYNSWVVARFKNSYNRDTHLIGYDFRWSYQGLHAGIIAAVSHGYRECFGDNGNGPRFCPTPIPYIGYDAPVSPKIIFSHQMVGVIGTVRF